MDSESNYLKIQISEMSDPDKPALFSNRSDIYQLRVLDHCSKQKDNKELTNEEQDLHEAIFDDEFEVLESVEVHPLDEPWDCGEDFDKDCDEDLLDD